ncbi:phenylalanine--tRNA ligase subunit beta [bacterium]|nr:phenylalanine--tRNA ligase subunit beta [bacterium]
MKATLSWLQEFVDITMPPQQLADALTMAGLEVESWEPVKRRFSQVVAAKVLSCVPMENAEGRWLCQVDAGAAPVQVISAAPNTTQGILVPMAQPGATLADGTKVGIRNLHGIASVGMLCSEAELGLTERGEGLMVLSADVQPGTDLKKVVGDQDYVFDVFITPNRPDCLSIIGLAREISAITGMRLRRPKISLPRIKGPHRSGMKIKIQSPEHCYRYSGRMLEHITIQPSPYWMASRLYACGMRAINNVVDVTNYVMLESGQPLHAFDYRMLEKHEIRVRTAHSGESFVTLDGQERMLDEAMCLICDGAKPIALAGVMGGMNSEVLADTDTVYLESAYFEPTGIRRTSKKLDLSTESSRRFERGTDPNGTLYALNRAAQLLLQVAGAKLRGEADDVVSHKVKPAKVAVSVKNINRLLGAKISKNKIGAILAPLEISLARSEGDRLELSIPTFRPDLTREIDIVEEVGRLYGYDRIPQAISARIDQTQTSNEQVAFLDRLRVLLSGFGLRETVSLSLVTPQIADRFLPVDGERVELLNPLSAELSTFRPSLLISALANIAYNRNRQISTLRFFEIGNAAWKQQGRFVEKKQGVVVLAGDRQEQAWYSRTHAFDFYDIKGIASALMEKLAINAYELRPVASPIWHAESVSLLINNQELGVLGRIQRAICEEFKIKTDDVFAFIFDFERLAQAASRSRSFTPVPRFPSAPFDLAILADVNTPVAEIEAVIRNAGGPHLSSVHLFDFYKGEQVPAGRKSLAFSLTFTSKERTLGESEIEEWVRAILDRLKSDLNAELRPR